MSEKISDSQNIEEKSSSKERGQKKAIVPFMQNRELSWLDFNKRVLDQGADSTVPLLERLGFVSIFWSNLQEFFMIRVGSLTDLSLLKKTIVDNKTGMSTEEQLSAVYRRCHELNPYYEKCYEDLRDELASEGIVNLRAKQLNDEQIDYINDYFHINIMPFLSPQIINPRHPFPHLENGALYVIVRLDEGAANADKKKDRDGAKTEKLDKQDKAASSKEEKSSKGGKKSDKQSKGKNKASKNMGAEGVTLGIIPMPRQCPRIIRLPGNGMQFILLEHAIEMFVDDIYSMYKVKHTNVICVTRNADLDATEGADEQGDDYREHIKKILKKRTRLMPVRLESEKELSATVKPLLLERLGLREAQLFVSKVPLDMSYAFELSSMIDESVKQKLTYTPFKPQWPVSIDPRESILNQASEHDILLSYPYESMEAFIQMLKEAVQDPSVVSIKITLYRLAKRSQLAEALIAAAEAGKEVTALFELRARFDESNNIEWSQRFEEAGCNVIYGFRDYKVHSKICCITRQTKNGLQYITQLGTGNYNEKTARLYTDFSFITADPEIGSEAAAFFRNMTLENISDEYKVLWVAPLQIKQNIIAGIDEQIALAKEGKRASLFFKTNSITDKELIDKIVEASQAGVQCTLLVRGISCIVPGIPGYTDNVCVVSIVGRLLEHSRIYIFGSFETDYKMYLSSADLMTRNMDKRIEIAWPINTPSLRNQIIGYIGTCMADTSKLRDLLPNRTYTDIGFFAKPEHEGGEAVLFDSQNYLISEAENRHMVADEVLASAQDENVDKIRDLAIDEIDLNKLRTEVSELKNAIQDTSSMKTAEIDPVIDEPAYFETSQQETDEYEAVGFDAVAEDDEDFSESTQQFETIDASNLPGIEGLYAPEYNPDGTFTIPGLAGGTLKLERAGGPVLEGGDGFASDLPDNTEVETADDFADSSGLSDMTDIERTSEYAEETELVAGVPGYTEETEFVESDENYASSADMELDISSIIDNSMVLDIPIQDDFAIQSEMQPYVENAESEIESIQQNVEAVHPDVEVAQEATESVESNSELDQADLENMPIPQSKPILGSPEGSPFVEVPEEPSQIDIPKEEKRSFFGRIFKKD